MGLAVGFLHVRGMLSGWLLSLIRFSLISFILASLSSVQATAQELEPIFKKGDAVVTGFSGVALLKPSPGAKLEDFAIINQQGATLQIFDMSQMGGADDARLVKAQRFFSVTAGQVGQVFGVTLDDGLDNPAGMPKTPNIYATATSVFGLQIVKTVNGVRNRAKVGGSDRTWLEGQFGFGAGGGPGSIWKIDGNTGEVTLFANVTLNGVPNSGPALGNITFDRRSRKLFVSDLQTGMIHTFGLDGIETAIFDHGFTVRSEQGLPADPYNPATRVNITSPSFNASQPASWGFASAARNVWGLAISSGRLYYSVAEGPEIWSVGITKDGAFANDARLEIEVKAPSSNPISDIKFAGNGTIYLAQRGQAVSSYDYTVFATPQTASVLRYKKRKLSNGRLEWQPAPDEYAVGFAQGFRNANGGIALGYGYDQFGYIRYNSCKSTLWSTGEALRQSTQYQNQLSSGGELTVHGLQGNSANLVRRSNNKGPFKSYFIDFDSNHADPTYRGHMGDVAIWSDCAGKPGPKRPVGPNIKVAKSCSVSSFNGEMSCRVTLTNTGSKAPEDDVSFFDFAEVLKGPDPANINFLIKDFFADDESWQCSQVPADELSCTIPGALMNPGARHSVDVVMNIADLTPVSGWEFRNCAELDGADQKRCVTRGEDNTLLVTKSGPAQQVCIPGGPCDFEVTVINPGKRTFDGELLFADNMTIGGVPAQNIDVENISPLHGCIISTSSMPVQWQCHTTIPPGGFKTFNILMTIPKSSVPAGVTQGRNCFVSIDPNLLAPANSSSSIDWTNLLDPINAGFSPNRHCVNFELEPGTPPIRPPGLPLLGGKMQMSVVAQPSIFTKAGQTIGYQYTILNTGNVAVTNFALSDTNVTSFKCPTAKNGQLAVGTSTICTGTYTSKPGDVGKDIISTAKLTGKTAIGATPPRSVKTTVKFIDPPSVSFAVTALPATFSAANLKISYSFKIKNTGGSPIISFLVQDTKATGIKCLSAKAKSRSSRLAPGATVICTGTYTTSAADVGTDITSTAIFVGQTPIGVAQKKTANTVVKFVKPKTVNSALNLSVVAAPASFTSANQTITYIYTLKNSGSAAVATFTLADSTATSINCPPTNAGPSGGPLASGASVTCIGNYTTKPGDVGNDITGVASVASATGVGSIKLPVPANVVVKFIKPIIPLVPVVPVTPKPAGKPKLEIVQYVTDIRTYKKAKQRIRYQYQINNIGAVSIKSIKLVDSRVTNVTCGKMPLAVNNFTICRGSYMTTRKDVGKDVVSQVNVTGVSASGAKSPAVTSKRVVKYTGPPKVAGNPKGAPKHNFQVGFINANPKTFSKAGQKIVYNINIGTIARLSKEIKKLPSYPPNTAVFLVSGVKINNIKCIPNFTDPIGRPLRLDKKWPDINNCKGTYTTTAADVGKDIESKVKVLGLPGSRMKPSGHGDEGKVVVKFVKLKVTPKFNFQVGNIIANPKTFSKAGQKIDYEIIIGTIARRSNDIKELPSYPPNTAVFLVNGVKINNIRCMPNFADPIGRPLRIDKKWPDFNSCKGTYTTTAADVGKDIESKAKVTGLPGSGMLPGGYGDDGKVVVAFIKPKAAPKPTFSLHHECSPKVYSAAGQTIGCEFVVRNIGTVPIKSCQIIGNRLTAICPPGLIPPGGSVFVKGSYTTTAADVGKNIVIDYKLDGVTQ